MTLEQLSTAFNEAVKVQNNALMLGILDQLIDKSARKEKIDWLKTQYYVLDDLGALEEAFQVCNKIFALEPDNHELRIRSVKKQMELAGSNKDKLMRVLTECFRVQAQVKMTLAKENVVFVNYTEERLRNDTQTLSLKASSCLKQIGDQNEFYQFKICGINEHGSLGLQVNTNFNKLFTLP